MKIINKCSPCRNKKNPRQAGRKILAMLSAVVMLCLGQSSIAAISSSPTSWPGGRWVPDDQQYGMVVEKSVPLVMSDGVTLYADIGYPADKKTGERAAGTFPVLLTQNPYDIPFTNLSAFKPDSLFVSRGYIYAVVQVRGTGRTEGPNGSHIANELFSAREAVDGTELVDWAAYKLGGSNGTVGLIGCSFLGISQIFTAAAVGPNSPVKAMVPACAGIGYELFFPGGIGSGILPLFTSNGIGLILGLRNFNESLAFQASKGKEFSEGGDAAYNRDHWQTRNTSRVAPQVVNNDIPALLWSGWNAMELDYAFALYSIFQNVAAGRPPFGPMTTNQAVTGRYQIVLGAGSHGIGPDRTLMLEWFDHWLKGQDTGIDRTSTPMHLFEMQSRRWVNASRMPAVETYTPFYIGADGALTTAAASSGQDTIRWAPLSENGSTLTYTSAPMQQAKTIAGPIAATVWSSSTNTNMQLVATLYDVDTLGATKRISFGGLIGSMRAEGENSWLDASNAMIRPDHPFTDDEYLTPNQTERFDIKLYPTVWALRAGHSLRLVISTQADSRDCQPTSIITGLSAPCVYSLPQQNTLPGGVYTVQRGGDKATVINVPLVDSASIPTARGINRPMDWGPTSD
jgi:predicted acyl esterase